MSSINASNTASARISVQPSSFPVRDLQRQTFSPGIEVDGTLWLSGYTAVRVDPVSMRSTVDGTIAEQMREIYAKIQAVVETAGLDLTDVVRTIDYVAAAGRDDYLRTADMRSTVFGACPPAASTVVVDRLLRPGALIEIEVLAERDAKSNVDRTVPHADSRTTPARRVGDIVYLSTLAVPELDQKDVADSAGVLQQTREIYARAGKVLVESGLELSNVVKVVEFLTPEARRHYADVRQVRESSFAHKVATTTVVMAQRMHLGALVQIEFVAAADRTLVRDVDGDGDGDRAAAIRVDRAVFASGQRAVSRSSGTVQYGRDIVNQTRAAYDNLLAALAAAGATPDSVVHTTEFVAPAGLGDYRRTAEVRRDVFKPPYPTATGIVCTELIDRDALIEVEATAIIDPA